VHRVQAGSRRRKLGQHYLVDQDIVQKIVSTAGVRKSEVVLEIGTGRGVLTSLLAQSCLRLEGYEVDPANVEETRRSVKADNLTLYQADAFKARPSFDVLVSSLPYSASAVFIDWLSQVAYDRAVVLLQEDFVQKIMAPAGSRNYRAVSVITQISSDVRLGERVGRSAFSPPPRVSSRIVTFRPRIRMQKQQVIMVKRLFALRRRTVGSALAKVGFGPTASTEGSTRRVYHLTPTEVYQIASKLSVL
jgi:16S rRNA (adenine1518-N6/adenine1519-N6)-dimethyltransferase